MGRMLCCLPSMLSLADLGAVASNPGRGAPARVRCATADQAVRILATLSDTEIRCAPDIRARALAAVIDWIIDDQQDQQDVRDGMARMMLDAARAVGATISARVGP